MALAERYFGWIHKPVEAKAYASTLERGDDFWAGLRAAEDDGNRFFYRALRMSLVSAGSTKWLRDRGGVPCIRAYDQGDIGSCVGNAEARRQAYLAALDVWYRLDWESFTGMFSPEWAYYASRKESNMLGTGDGSTGYGAAKANTTLGALVQGKYGATDLSDYSVSRCRQFGGGRGIPQEARDEAQKHKCGKYLAVDTVEKAWLCAGAGLPVNQCSDVGWEGERDGDGAIRRRGSWGHSMVLGGARYTTAKGRQLLLIDNSWGDDFVGGPYCGDQPFGSFYADLGDVDRAVSQGDTFVDIEYAGDPAASVPFSFTEM